MKCAIIALAVFVVISTGCSDGKLTRREAEAAINQHYKTAGDWYAPQVIAHFGGKVSGYCSEFSRKYGLAAKDDVLQSSVDQIPVLERIGAVRIEKTGQPRVYDISLTDLAKQSAGEPYAHETFEQSCDWWQVNLKVAAFDAAEVTGIVQEGVRAKVEVNLCRKLTPFGEKFLNGTPGDHHGLNNSFNLGYRRNNGKYCKSEELPFQKYDDGWRLQ